jgi:prepilin-type N-terminal cleavage/methylation domain-containing protein
MHSQEDGGIFESVRIREASWSACAPRRSGSTAESPAEFQGTRIRREKLESPAVDSYGGNRECRRIGSYGERGFTVTELMVAVSLMSLIVFALYAMFNQTQKAMRANEAQVDSTERGRSVLELVSREIESARAGIQGNVTNLWLTTAPGTKKIQGDQPNASLTVVPRTNVFDNIFYLTKASKAWKGVGYTVLTTTNVGDRELVTPVNGALGTLYRYETPEDRVEYGHPSTNLFKYFLGLSPLISGVAPPVTNFNQIAEGIVHFKLLPYDTQGRIMAFNSTNLDSNYRIYRTLADGTKMGAGFLTAGVTNGAQATVTLRQAFLGDETETMASFRSNALPAYLELELGVLEPDTMRQYRQMVKDGLQTQADQFVARRINKVQIFRKRIPLRSVAQ